MKAKTQHSKTLTLAARTIIAAAEKATWMQGGAQTAAKFAHLRPGSTANEAAKSNLAGGDYAHLLPCGRVLTSTARAIINAGKKAGIVLEGAQ